MKPADMVSRSVYFGVVRASPDYVLPKDVMALLSV